MSSSVQVNNKRIAKNTLFLYLRMVFILCINLFASRMILKYLGVSDFGIYNVVGGCTALIGMFNSAMIVSTQRYLSFELGVGNFEALSKVFSVSLSIYVIVSILFFIAAETIGLWFLNTQLVIPESRIYAANWVFQLSILSVINSLLYDPYNASVIAHEKMNVYAFMSIAQSALLLLIVFCLPLIPFDRLIVYALLYFFVTLVITLACRIYCVRNFKECKFKFVRDKSLFKEIISYSGWNFFGSAAGVAKGHGLNILLNIFFSPVVNAANAIAAQIISGVSMLFSNFYMAVSPQITKSYAAKEYNDMFNLIFRSSKFSFFLIFIVALPILIETPYIVNIWLGQIPQYVVPFTRIVIIIAAVDAISSPLMTSLHATGKIKLYQIVVGATTILIVPISYLFLSMGNPAISVFVVSLAVSILNFLLRIAFVKYQIPAFSSRAFLREVAIRIIAVVLLSAIIAWAFSTIAVETTFLWVVSNCFVYVLVAFFAIIVFGLTQDEKNFFLNYIRNKIHDKFSTK